MSTPSLLLVPARIKAGGTFLGTPGIVYSQIPTNGDGDFRLQRDGLFQTRYNDQGLVERVGTNNNVNVIPRLDYYTSGGVTGCPALLVEPAATNSALQSAGFQVSGTWAPTNISVTTGTTSAFTAPDGSTDADLLADDATSGRHRVQQNLLSFTSGTTYTFSVFVKKNSSNRFLLINANTAFNSVAALSLDTLAITNIGGSGASVENYGNGWYRFSIRGTASATTAGGTVFVQMQDTNADGTYIGNGSSFYLWGAQLETGSVATSYIPTTTAQRTRNADVISVSGAVSGSIGQTEGVLYIECESNFANDDIIAINRDFSNALTIYKGGSNQVIGRVYASGATFSFTSSATTGVMKIALAYKSGDSALFLNGVQVGSTNTTALTFSAALNLISMTKAASYLVGVAPTRIRAVALYTTRLTNADLMLLTMPGNDTYLPQAVWNNYLSRPGNTEVPDCLYTRHADLLDV